MIKKRNHLRRLWITLALALGLTILPQIATPLLSDELAARLFGPAVVLADEPQDGTGG